MAESCSLGAWLQARCSRGGLAGSGSPASGLPAACGSPGPSHPCPSSPSASTHLPTGPMSTLLLQEWILWSQEIHRTAPGGWELRAGCLPAAPGGGPLPGGVVVGMARWSSWPRRAIRAPGQGPGGRGSLGRSSLGPHIPLPHFTDDDSDPQLMRTRNLAWSPKLQLWAHSALVRGLRLLRWPGGGTPAPPAHATGTGRRYREASGCVCWGLQPRVGDCSYGWGTAAPLGLRRCPPGSRPPSNHLDDGSASGGGMGGRVGDWIGEGKGGVENHWRSLHILEACIYGSFGSKARSSPVLIPIPAVLPSAPGSPTVCLASLWGMAILLLPLGIIRTPACCPLGMRTGMVVTGVWPLLVPCLSSRKDLLISKRHGVGAPG